MPDDRIRVYLLDDHEVVRQGLRALLEGAGDIEVVGESDSAVEATHRIPALRPHVAVLDGRLPDGSGIEVYRAVRAIDPDIQALILTSYDNDEALFAAIMAGAAGYPAILAFQGRGWSFTCRPGRPPTARDPAR
jgi:DNA-binding NarL/FixJ family response regulator